jgi:hypothetical protein
MGGVGSTRWGWRSTRATTDTALALDVRVLARNGSFAAKHGDVARSIISWTSPCQESGQIGVEYVGTNPRRITLHYLVQIPGGQRRQVAEPIEVTRTHCHFGGQRVWFICPGCGARRALLHAVGGVFRCRVCHDLAYRSTRAPSVTRAKPDRHTRLRSADNEPRTPPYRGREDG